MKDVTILYQGGSGGFALYYYLLLSGNYQCTVVEAQEMIKKQFPLTLADDHSNWKSNELWPDNFSLKQQSGSKVFLICNPLFDQNLYETYRAISQDTYKILLYTDIHLQLRMAYEKNAYWFTAVSKKYFNAPADLKKYLRQILNSRVSYNNIEVDPMMPAVVDKFFPEQLIRLEEFIRLGVLDNFPTPTKEQIEFLNHWRSLQPPKVKFF